MYHRTKNKKNGTESVQGRLGNRLTSHECQNQQNIVKIVIWMIRLEKLEQAGGQIERVMEIGGKLLISFDNSAQQAQRILITKQGEHLIQGECFV